MTEEPTYDEVIIYRRPRDASPADPWSMFHFPNVKDFKIEPKCQDPDDFRLGGIIYSLGTSTVIGIDFSGKALPDLNSDRTVIGTAYTNQYRP